jgi:hypothetical protein
VVSPTRKVVVVDGLDAEEDVLVRKPRPHKWTA